MAEPPKGCSRRYGFPPQAWDPSAISDLQADFVNPDDIEAFAQALTSPGPLLSPADDSSSVRSLGRRSYSDLTKRNSGLPDENAVGRTLSGASEAFAEVDSPLSKPVSTSLSYGTFFAARHDWTPVHPKALSAASVAADAAAASAVSAAAAPRRFRSNRKRRAGRAAAALSGRRTKDETRDGYFHAILKWPMLLFVGTWLLGLSALYLLTRFYILTYEQMTWWRGRRAQLRRNMRCASTYRDWVAAARELDSYLNRESWKEENHFAYYDSKSVKSVYSQIRKSRLSLLAVERDGQPDSAASVAALDNLEQLLVACVRNNFAGVENARLYSQTYYGTKNLVQNFVDELEKSLQLVLDTNRLDRSAKREVFKKLHASYGRTALCLSGGAGFAYYHIGVVKALLEADLLPNVISGTSGGALVAALVATRTNEELSRLLVPALSHRIDACREPATTWIRRWWRTGARFDSVDWARRCSWWTRGSMTFREAYSRTGRILNVSCVPADPHSPTMLCNYLTSPDCVIWSAVIASAAVPGILNPVVLMMKTAAGTLVPYSFGHTWKDGSLRSDIPTRALNLFFNCDFTIVSQVNPHVNLFFFSSRGRVGNPVTHRKGRGWRGGFLMSALENYLKADLNKWLRFIRNTELLPRPLGQDWSQLWLQQFGGTITLWPKSTASDFWHILSDPEPARLARMIHEGQQSAFPVLKFVANRLKIERLVDRGWRETRTWLRSNSIDTILSEDDLRSLLSDPLHSRVDDHDSCTTGGVSSSATEDESDLDLQIGARVGKKALDLARSGTEEDDDVDFQDAEDGFEDAAFD